MWAVSCQKPISEGAEVGSPAGVATSGSPPSPLLEEGEGDGEEIRSVRVTTAEQAPSPSPSPQDEADLPAAAAVAAESGEEEEEDEEYLDEPPAELLTEPAPRPDLIDQLQIDLHQTQIQLHREQDRTRTANDLRNRVEAMYHGQRIQLQELERENPEAAQGIMELAHRAEMAAAEAERFEEMARDLQVHNGELQQELAVMTANSARNVRERDQMHAELHRWHRMALRLNNERAPEDQYNLPNLAHDDDNEFDAGHEFSEPAAPRLSPPPPQSPVPAPAPAPASAPAQEAEEAAGQEGQLPDVVGEEDPGGRVDWEVETVVNSE